MQQDTDVARMAAALKAPGLRYRNFGNGVVRRAAADAGRQEGPAPVPPREDRAPVRETAPAALTLHTVPAETASPRRAPDGPDLLRTLLSRPPVRPGGPAGEAPQEPAEGSLLRLLLWEPTPPHAPAAYALLRALPGEEAPGSGEHPGTPPPALLRPLADRPFRNIA